MRRGEKEVDLRIEGTIYGDGSVGIDAVSGCAEEPGVVEFCGTSAYAGTTKIKAGTLRVSTHDAPALCTGKVEVQAAGRLEGTSSIDPALASHGVVVSGTLAPGAPAGTLSVGSSGSENNVEMKSGSTLELNFSGADASALKVFGKFIVSDNVALKIIEDKDAGVTAFGQYEVLSASEGISGWFEKIELPSDEYSVYADNEVNI